VSEKEDLLKRIRVLSGPLTIVKGKVTVKPEDVKK